MRSAVGQSVVETAAAVRAGICRFEAWPAVAEDAAAIEVVGAAVRPALGDADWVEKADALATQPLHEALWMAELDDVVHGGQPTRWSLHLATPRFDREGVDPDDAQELLEDIHERSVFDVSPTLLTTVMRGNAGGLLALQEAVATLAQDKADVCVVGGVDSLLHTPYLNELEQAGRLKTSATPAGLVPGEAAAFVVIERAAHARRRGARALARFTTPRVAIERESPDGKQPGRGEAMARVLREVMRKTPCAPEKINRVLIDLNGERWRFLEWALACSPALIKLPPEWRLWHPADCYGDIGAATGVAHLCLATRAFERAYAQGDAIVACASADTGERAALIVYPPSEPTA
jgi:3-oxoacyl-[acyl-carrier-protein] synthase-1